VTLKKGDGTKLSVFYNPDNTTVNRDVVWSSSDEKVATVNEQGEITAVENGTAVVTAKVGDKTASCTVTVEEKEVALESISLDKTEVTLEKGDGTKLNVSYNPDNTTVDRDVTWSSSDEKVATVNEQGEIVAVDKGTAVVTAKVGDKTASCTVTVTESVEKPETPDEKPETPDEKPDETPGVAENELPVISAKDLEIYVGTTFHPLDGVTAHDKEDGDILLTQENIISNNVDTSKAGTYYVEYKVTDSDGASTTKKITVTVKEKASVMAVKNETTPKTGDGGFAGLLGLLGASGSMLAGLRLWRRKK